MSAQAGTRQDQGFSLVELLIVIVVLGILAAITTLAVSGITAQGQSSACGAELRTLRTAVEVYRVEDQGRDPGEDFAGLVAVQLLERPPQWHRWDSNTSTVAPALDGPCATG